MSQSQTLIDWSMIAREMNGEVFCTPSSLKARFSHLQDRFYPIINIDQIYTAHKQNYLKSLCRKIESKKEKVLDVIYELICHIKAQRIVLDDVDQLFNEWNTHNHENECQEIFKYILEILTRLKTYIQTRNKFINDSIHLKSLSNNQKLQVMQETANDESSYHSLDEIEDEITKSSIKEHQHGVSSKIDDNGTLNVGKDWFVPKLQQQKASANGESLSTDIDQSTLNSVIRTSEKEQSSEESMIDSSSHQTDAQPMIACKTLIPDQFVHRVNQSAESKYFDHIQLDQVSSDSDSIQIESVCTDDNLPLTNDQNIVVKTPSDEESNLRKRPRIS